MHLLLAYIKFLFRSTNQHGVHSPFVYNLLTQCLYKKDKKPAFTAISEYIKAIKQDHRVIQVKDFGAGSRVFKSNARKVSDIAKNAGISRKRAFLLNKLTSYFGIRSALELGTSVGISSAAIAAGNPVKLTTLEGCPETAAVAKEYFKRFKLDNIDLEVGSFEENLKGVESGQWKEDRGQWKEEPARTGRGGSGKKTVDSGACPNPQGREWKEDREKKTVESGQRTEDSGFNRQPTNDNRESQTTNHKQQTHNLQPTTYNSQLTTHNPQPTTDNREPQTTNHEQQTNPINLQHTTYNIQPITDNSQPTTYNLQHTTHNPQQPTTNLIYFDGNHQKEATLKYFELLLPLAHNESVFIFDDIHWSKGMEEAWEEIKAHPGVRVTIDSFYWGIVFFRQEQEKEHFIIRL